jgi:hypothetical protein
LTLYYSNEEFILSGLDESNLTLWKYENDHWIDKGYTNRDVLNNSVTISNVDIVGNWAFADLSNYPLPVSLINCKAEYISGDIKIQWETVSELNNTGFEILRKSGDSDGFKIIASYKTDQQLQGLGNSSTGKEYFYIDRDIYASTLYQYKIYTVDYSGLKQEYGTISIDISKNKLPDIYCVSNNYPNPFNATTIFRIVIAKTSDIIIRIYNILGELVNEVVYKSLDQGIKHVRCDGKNIASGIYFYKFIVRNEIFTKTIKSGKFVVLK